MITPLLTERVNINRKSKAVKTFIFALLLGGFLLFVSWNVSKSGALGETAISGGSCAFGGCQVCVDNLYGVDKYQSTIRNNGDRGKISATIKMMFGKCVSCCSDADLRPTTQIVAKKKAAVKVVEHVGTKTHGLTLQQIKENQGSIDQIDGSESIDSNQVTDGGSLPELITNIPQTRPRSTWQSELLQMHGGPGSAYFWGWGRTVGASDVQGLFRALLATYPTLDKNEIFIYSGSHGDRNGRLDFDVPQDQQTLDKYREVKFWHEDIATVKYEQKMGRLRGWQVSLRNLEYYNALDDGFLVNLLKDLAPGSKFRHVIWAFCYSADGTNDPTKTVTQHVIAKKNFRAERALWTAPTYKLDGVVEDH